MSISLMTTWPFFVCTDVMTPTGPPFKPLLHMSSKLKTAGSRAEEEVHVISRVPPSNMSFRSLGISRLSAWYPSRTRRSILKNEFQLIAHSVERKRLDLQELVERPDPHSGGSDRLQSRVMFKGKWIWESAE